MRKIRTTRHGKPSWINVDKDVRAMRVAITKKSIDVATALGCMSVQTGSGKVANAGFPMHNVAWKYLVEGLEECADYAGSKGIVLTLEAEPDTLVENTVDLAHIVKDVKAKSFALTLDIGHAA